MLPNLKAQQRVSDLEDISGNSDLININEIEIPISSDSTKKDTQQTRILSRKGDYLTFTEPNLEDYDENFKSHIKGEFKVVQYESGSKYEGEMNEDEMEGYGRFYNSIFNSNLEGYFKNDLANGVVTRVDAIGNEYTGEYRNGNMEGYGIYKYENGYVYRGNFKENMKSGYGIFEYKNGDVYKGYFENNLFSGYGQLTIADKNNPDHPPEISFGGFTLITSVNEGIFEGDFQDYNFVGHGKCTYLNGCKYTGEFINNRFEGKGTYTWPNDIYYCGDWKNDKRHGIGKMLFSNGKVYFGEWKNDFKDGEGEIKYANGSVKEGTFRNGKCIKVHYTRANTDFGNFGLLSGNEARRYSNRKCCIM